jgi:hypothetical protein
VSKLYKNKYSHLCVAPGCPRAERKEKVPVGEGFAFRQENGRWATVCNSSACIEALGLKVPEPEDTRRLIEADGTIRMPYDPNALPLLRALPPPASQKSAWDAKNKVWRASMDPKDRPRVLELAEQLSLEIAPELREFSYGEAIETILAEATEKGAYPFQLDGIAHLASHPRALLADDQGLGKTIEVLLALPKDAAVLAIVPANVKFNWRNEAKKWAPHFEVKCLSGRKCLDSLAALPAPGEMVVVNYDILPKWAADPSDEEKAALKGIILIADECQRAKNHKAARSKRVRGIAEHCAQVWGLTGTPLQNRPPDLWGVLQSLNMGREVFGSWGTFTRVMNGYKGRYGWEWGIPTPECPERMRRVMIRRMKEEVLPDLPAITRQALVVNGLSKTLLKKLDQLWEHWADTIAIGELPSFDEFSEVRAEMAKARTPAMLDLVADYEENEKPVLVFSAHRFPIDTLAARDGWATITGDTPAAKRAEIVEAFQAGKLKGLGLTIKAGGEGITLTRADTEIFVDLDWNPSGNRQAEDRMRRIGQEAASLHVIQMTSDHKLDRHVNALINSKAQVIAAAIEATHKFVPRDGSNGSNGVQVRHESEEDRRAAFEAIGRDEHASRVQLLLGRQKERSPERPQLDLTPEVKGALKGAYEYMISVCDGAVAKDGQGFNKPDAAISRFLMAYDLDTDDACRALEGLLFKYKRQLKSDFPILFP